MTRQRDDLHTYAEDELTVDDTAGGVRIPISDLLVTPPCRRVEMFVEDAQIRVTTGSGEAPTSSVGEILNPFDRYTLENIQDAINFRAIRTGASSATIHYRCMR